MSLLNIVLQAGGIAGSLMESLPLILIIVVFYFFFIRPQSKKQKEQLSFVDAMDKGDEVVTASGMIGRINKMDEHTVTLQVDTKTFIRVTKNSISKEMTESVSAALNEPVKS